MKKLLIVVLLLVIGLGALGYFRGWYTLVNEQKGGVRIDSAKFREDRDAFGQSIQEKARSLKEQVSSLWKSSEGLSEKENEHNREALNELKKKHDRLEEQIRELANAGPDKFESTKHDLNQSLDAVEQKIAEISKKLDKGHK